MSEKFVSRKDLKKALIKWQKGTLSEKEIWEWANRIYLPGDTEFDDWESDDEEEVSVTNEVLGSLDCLDMNLIISDDIPIYLEFLETPIGKFQEGYTRWNRKLNSINYKERCKKLKDHPIYGPFCK